VWVQCEFTLRCESARQYRGPGVASCWGPVSATPTPYKVELLLPLMRGIMIPFAARGGNLAFFCSDGGSAGKKPLVDRRGQEAAGGPEG
jgi:hypothetical protein